MTTRSPFIAFHFSNLASPTTALSLALGLWLHKLHLFTIGLLRPFAYRHDVVKPMDSKKTMMQSNDHHDIARAHIRDFPTDDFWTIVVGEGSAALRSILGVTQELH